MRIMASWVRGVVLVALAALDCPEPVKSVVRHYNFTVVSKNTTRMCSSKPIVVVNGKFPRPSLYATEDDTVIVRVVNHSRKCFMFH